MRTTTMKTQMLRITLPWIAHLARLWRIALPLVLAASCGPMWEQRWATLGVDSGKCAVQAGLQVATTVLVDALASANGQAQDWTSIGEQLGAKYGAQGAGCIINAALNDLAAPPHAALSPHALRRRLSAHSGVLWLRQHPEVIERGARNQGDDGGGTP